MGLLEMGDNPVNQVTRTSDYRLPSPPECLTTDRKSEIKKTAASVLDAAVLN